MPEYQFTGDDLTDFPWLGVSLKPGETVITDHPEAANHPLLKRFTGKTKPSDVKSEDKEK